MSATRRGEAFSLTTGQPVSRRSGAGAVNRYDFAVQFCDAQWRRTSGVSPLGKRVYDLRHTCLTNWLNDGAPPAQVAEWAGNRVPVLPATYARCISGQLSDLKKRIEAGGDLSELPAAD
ncbi:hypothetical protein [Streptomyces inhibens]|uniref:hypothetical protein n=1 Tax=Streptomyces inhibens TaxID=2293571 RepID=UPI001EE743EA|nr:hypothetical protein [Streptomyces inhibens]UKY50311.1 hypothetical protein KI385_16790 [Streptomyces inhibens]